MHNCLEYIPKIESLSFGRKLLSVAQRKVCCTLCGFHDSRIADEKAQTVSLTNDIHFSIEIFYHHQFIENTLPFKMSSSLM